MYHLRLSELRGSLPWSVIVQDKSHGGHRESELDMRRAVKTVGVCLTPHAVNIPQELWGGFCLVCRANGAGQTPIKHRKGGK